MTRLLIPVLSALVLIVVCVHARAAEPSRVPCWQVRLLLHHHNGDKAAARQAARARGYSEGQIADAERRCAP